MSKADVHQVKTARFVWQVIEVHPAVSSCGRYMAYSSNLRRRVSLDQKRKLVTTYSQLGGTYLALLSAPPLTQAGQAGRTCVAWAPYLLLVSRLWR